MKTRDNDRRTWERMISILVSIVMGLIISSQAYALDASFDWRMPDRFGLDSDGDRKIDYFATNKKYYPEDHPADPGKFEVYFKAKECGYAKYQWEITPSVVPTPIVRYSCEEFSPGKVFDERTYKVKLTVFDQNNNSEESVPQDVVVQDWLIVAVGDSIGSGEGNPALNFTDLLTDALFDLAEKKALETAACLGCWPGCDPTKYDQKMIDGTACDCSPYCDQHFCCPIDVPLKGCYCVATCLPNSDNFTNCKDATNERMATENYVKNLWAYIVDNAPNHDVTEREKLLWQDGLCHRSANSYQARAAKEIEDADDKTSVTFVHLSCEGANIKNGLTDSWWRQRLFFDEDGNPIGGEEDYSQLDKAKELIGDREIDAFVISIGGNDVGTSDILGICLYTKDCQKVLDEGQSLEEDVCNAIDVKAWKKALDTYHSGGNRWKEGLQDFKSHLWGDANNDPLNIVLEGKYPSLPANRVYMNEFISFVKDLGTEAEKKDYCDWPSIDPNPLSWFEGFVDFLNFLTQVEQQTSMNLDPLIWLEAWRVATGQIIEAAGQIARGLPCLQYEEAKWAESECLVQLNEEIAKTGDSRQNGGFEWNVVDGIDEAYAEHGYCVPPNHWIMRAEESIPVQGDILGTGHPNREAHEFMAKKLVDKIGPDFYPGYAENDFSNPRRPQYLVADPGGPYEVLEGSSITLENNSYTPYDDLLSYEWTLGPDLSSKVLLDNPNAKNPVLSGIDDATGRLSLRVLDSTSSDLNWATVTVINVPPTVNAIQDDLLEHTGFFNKPVNFTGSFSDPGVLDTYSFLWEFGDGATAPGSLPANVAKTLTTSHAYAYAGAETATYKVTLTVTDDDGGSGKNELTVTIRSAQQAAQELSSYINSLPNNCFSKKGLTQKNTLILKLQEVILKIKDKLYQDAINKLLYDIRVRADGINPSEDWITNRDAQNKICSYIDALVSYLRFLQGQP